MTACPGGSGLNDLEPSSAAFALHRSQEECISSEPQHDAHDTSTPRPASPATNFSRKRTLASNLQAALETTASSNETELCERAQKVLKRMSREKTQFHASQSTNPCNCVQQCSSTAMQQAQQMVRSSCSSANATNGCGLTIPSHALAGAHPASTGLPITMFEAAAQQAAAAAKPASSAQRATMFDAVAASAVVPTLKSSQPAMLRQQPTSYAAQPAALRAGTKFAQAPTMFDRWTQQRQSIWPAVQGSRAWQQGAYSVHLAEQGALEQGSQHGASMFEQWTGVRSEVSQPRLKPTLKPAP